MNGKLKFIEVVGKKKLNEGVEMAKKYLPIYDELTDAEKLEVLRMFDKKDVVLIAKYADKALRDIKRLAGKL